MPDSQLINLYGPTESTINSSSHVVDPAELAEAPKSISIGSPVANTSYLVLDPDRRPVTPGEIGELYIGGIQLARGYLHQPELTEERFVGQPTCSAPVTWSPRTSTAPCSSPAGRTTR